MTPSSRTTLGLFARLLAAALLWPTLAQAAPTFIEIGAGFTGLWDAALQWGDYDNDGDLDLVAVGSSAVGPLARLYKNTGGVFTNSGALPASAAAQVAAVAWGDYDRDGDLDLAVMGAGLSGAFTRIYRNDAGSFVDLAAGLEGLREGGLAWGDLDNDGDLDLAVTGYTGTAARTTLYRNNAGVFADAGAGLTPMRFSSLAWADYDVDGDLDLVVAGVTTGVTYVTRLYKNNGGVLVNVPASIPGIQEGSVDWADCDRDGDPDLLVTGANVTTALRNNSGNFTSFGLLELLANSCARWGDVSNDGLPDVALVGTTGSIGFGAVYLNTAGSSFTDAGADLARLQVGAVAWGDYDNDGDLDLTLAGMEDQGTLFEVHRLYRTGSVPPNTLPGVPGGRFTTVTNSTVTFHWSPPFDPQGAGLTYNLWAGTAPGTANVVAPHANLTTGWRRIAAAGNVGHNSQWTMPLSAFPGGQIYWGVQAVDHAFAGSAFGTGQLLLDVDGAPGVTALALRVAGANPARADTRLAYALPRDAHVELAIHDVTGRRVRTLARGTFAAGTHEIAWDGADAGGTRLPPGLYLARLDAGAESVTAKLIRIE